jgi:hypothetical protein
MTKLGKYLVFINLVLSLMFLGVAIGVCSNRIDWPGTMKTGPASEVKAGVDRLKSEIDTWQKEASLGYARATAALPDLLQVEKERPVKQKWYADQLSILETGNDTDGKAYSGPIQDLVYEKGQIKLGKDGLPELRPISVKPLEFRPIPEMHKMLADQQDAVKQEMAKVAKLMQEEERLTREVNGDPQKKVKGLRDLQAEEISVENNLQGELEYLRPLRYNRQVEAALLLKRQQSLKARLDELKNTGVASR